VNLHFPFVNRCLALPATCHARVLPTPVAAPSLIAFNAPLAAELGITHDLPADPAVLAAVFSGNTVPQGAASVALAYAGHQFGGFSPQLGDGRAILMGDVVDRQGQTRDLQWKGTGRTPFSRGGDGRAALGPVLREYLVSEAMHALGVPTTRALAAVTTGEPVLRDSPLPGGVVTRVAASHLRIGTFQYFAARRDFTTLQALAREAIDRHYPTLASADNPALALLTAVADRQSALVAKWLGLGFIHGVMNTDNMTLSGETIDYGPCAFMETFDPDTVFSAIDTHGRYAYAQQPLILQWNLARLAEALLPLMAEDPRQAVAPAMEVLEAVPAKVSGYWLAGFRAKLGLTTARESDADLVNGLLQAMQATEADFTETFRRLADVAAADASAGTGLSSGLSVGPSSPRSPALPPSFPAGLKPWLAQWQARLAEEPTESRGSRAAAMHRANPLFIPRNHRVEEAIRAAEDHDDFAPFQRLLEVVTKPWDDVAEHLAYARPALPGERVTRTFCGT
jgi:serine/tyrosine/threonine adenylyltransferase